MAAVLFALGTSMSGVDAASVSRVAPLFQTWSTYFNGTWSCVSGKTPYSVTYRPALGGRWIRGINTSRRSQSEDMMTYDAHTKQWTLFDMEPSGVWFAMHGQSRGSTIYLHDVPTHLNLAVHRISANEYHLEFQPQNGNAGGSADVCKRRV